MGLEIFRTNLIDTVTHLIHNSSLPTIPTSPLELVFQQALIGSPSILLIDGLTEVSESRSSLPESLMTIKLLNDLSFTCPLGLIFLIPITSPSNTLDLNLEIKEISITLTDPTKAQRGYLLESLLVRLSQKGPWKLIGTRDSIETLSNVGYFYNFSLFLDESFLLIESCEQSLLLNLLVLSFSFLSLFFEL